MSLRSVSVVFAFTVAACSQGAPSQSQSPQSAQPQQPALVVAAGILQAACSDRPPSSSTAQPPPAAAKAGDSSAAVVATGTPPAAPSKTEPFDEPSPPLQYEAELPPSVRDAVYGRVTGDAQAAKEVDGSRQTAEEKVA